MHGERKQLGEEGLHPTGFQRQGRLDFTAPFGMAACVQDLKLFFGVSVQGKSVIRTYLYGIGAVISCSGTGSSVGENLLMVRWMKAGLPHESCCSMPISCQPQLLACVALVSSMSLRQAKRPAVCMGIVSEEKQVIASHQNKCLGRSTEGVPRRVRAHAVKCGILHTWRDSYLGVQVCLAGSSKCDAKGVLVAPQQPGELLGEAAK